MTVSGHCEPAGSCGIDPGWKSNSGCPKPKNPIWFTIFNGNKNTNTYETTQKAACKKKCCKSSD